ncbi:uncharacterized protein EV420DRAFT_320930 [Desarmillaria tabescens]|uniref:Uncharacterized protein n=1 Tax=Armillaria tabescens TaxID=1929756 RepID=A0AA39J3I5_ARMTA|nr:uncharacterized protein EV420DRAFT_320930 [Desarmillaria tabescens]KAK0435441.1 hypothetical protein EV420DRAFT_320930 [Desarmillaria tabescens]
MFSQNICGLCARGIHPHADYVSIIFNHYPTNQCAAYVQKTSLIQRCACEAQFCEHIAIDNSYRFLDPWTVLDHFNDTINGPYARSFVLFDYNAKFSSGDTDPIPITLAPIFSPFISSHTFSPSGARGTSLSFPLPSLLSIVTHLVFNWIPYRPKLITVTPILANVRRAPTRIS